MIPNKSSSCSNEARKWALFSFSLTVTILLGGIVYGFPALRYNLLDEEESLLSEQELGLVYTIGSGAQLCSGFVIGLLRDALGTRNAVQISMMSTVCGSTILAFCSPNSVWQLSLSLVLMEIGSGAQICVLPVAELFDNPGMVIGLLAGAFNISSLLFPLFFAISEDRRVGVGGYAITVLALEVVGFFLLPKGLSFLSEDSNRTSQPSSSIQSCRSDETKDNGDDGGDDHCNNDIANKKSTTTRQQITSLEYLCLLTWFAVSVVPMQYYAGSIGFQLENKGDSEGQYISLFSVFFAASPVFAPIAGYLADRFGVGWVQGVATLLNSMSFFVLLAEGLAVQIAGMSSYSLARMMVFATFYSNIGTRFGYESIGTLVGVGTVTSALLSLVQYPMLDAASSGLETTVNLSCAILFLGLLPYCILLGLKETSEWKESTANKVDPSVQPIDATNSKSVGSLSDGDEEEVSETAVSDSDEESC